MCFRNDGFRPESNAELLHQLAGEDLKQTLKELI